MTTKQYPGDPKSKKLKVVCVPCNTTWMSQLQNDSKDFLVPLLLGQNVSLHRRAQTLIATWATMFTMVAERFDTNQKMISIPNQQLLTFKRIKRPPKGWKIWVAPTSVESNGTFSRSTVPVSANDKMPEKDADGRDLPNTQTTTLRIGKLLIHTFSSVHAGTVKRKSLSGVTQIWPIKRSPIYWADCPTVEKEGADVIAEWLPVNGRQKAAELLKTGGDSFAKLR
ncbi:MAG: hypothetical protein AB7O70_00205 [Hyphomicrobiales bacterium]